MRTFFASLLAVGFLALVTFANLGVWVERQVVGTTSFLRLGEQVLDQGAVRAALADRIVTDVEARAPALVGRDATLRPLVAQVLAQPQFRPAFDTLLASTHDQLRSGHDPLQLDLTALLPVLRAQLPPTLATRLPSSFGLTPITVLRRRDAPALWDGVQGVQNVTLVVPVVTALVLIGAVIAARRRGAILIGLGLVTVILALGLIALLKPGRSVVAYATGTPAQQSAFLAGYDTVTRSFVVQTIGLAVFGGILAVAGCLVAWQRTRNVRPRHWA